MTEDDTEDPPETFDHKLNSGRPFDSTPLTAAEIAEAQRAKRELKERMSLALAKYLREQEQERTPASGQTPVPKPKT